MIRVRSCNSLATPVSYSGRYRRREGFRGEVLLDESERGVTVSLEGEFEEAPPMLRALRMGNTSVIIETDFRSYQLDFSRVELEEIKAMEKLLVKMNFDNKFIVESA